MNLKALISASMARFCSDDTLTGPTSSLRRYRPHRARVFRVGLTVNRSILIRASGNFRNALGNPAADAIGSKNRWAIAGTMLRVVKEGACVFI